MNGMQGAAVAPEARTLETGIVRMGRALRRATEIRSHLVSICDRLEPLAPSGEASNKVQEAGMIGLLHQQHDALSELMDEIAALAMRIERSVGSREVKAG